MKNIITHFFFIIAISMTSSAQEIDVKNNIRYWVKDADTTIGSYHLNEANALQKLINFKYEYPNSAPEIVTYGNIGVVVKNKKPLNPSIELEIPNGWDIEEMNPYKDLLYYTFDVQAYGDNYRAVGTFRLIDIKQMTDLGQDDYFIISCKNIPLRYRCIFYKDTFVITEQLGYADWVVVEN